MGIPVNVARLVGGLNKAASRPQEAAQRQARSIAQDELAALVQAARLGSEEAFSALFERFQTPLVNYLYRLVGDWEAANDLAQDTFLKAYQALPRTAEGLQISPWLYRIATNTALDALRRRKRITWVPMEAGHEPFAGDTSTRHAERDAIGRALEQVPTDQRTCLVLNMSQGLSYKEIAETLGISVNLVAVRIFRGREKFIEAYKRADSE